MAAQIMLKLTIRKKILFLNFIIGGGGHKLQIDKVITCRVYVVYDEFGNPPPQILFFGRIDLHFSQPQETRKGYFSVKVRFVICQLCLNRNIYNDNSTADLICSYLRTDTFEKKTQKNDQYVPFAPVRVQPIKSIKTSS